MHVRLQQVFAILLLGIWFADANQVLAAPTTYVTPEKAAVDPDFTVQGEYAGEQIGVQVIALGSGKFQVVMFPGGLPGAGWNGADRHELEEDKAFVADLVNDRKLKKVNRTGPTLDARPPTGAVVLFDGSDAILKKHWQAGANRDDNLLVQGCTTTDAFADFTLHLEFRLPFMPAARGQERGNSGVYLQGRYELQMLDSFGLVGLDNECGGLYGQKAPDINACLPPLSWQTYDIDFTAARRDATGKQISAARVTVRHNGLVIHQNVELPEATDVPPGALVVTGPVLLQDHGNPVRYRNIWVAPRSAELEARRPRVPGFERFYVGTGADPAEGGRLLLGEFNCLVCHQADEAFSRQLIARQSPILDEIGRYTHPEYLLKFLAEPHAVKPGTLMPDLLGKLPPTERADAVLALTNLLSSTGTVPERGSDTQAAMRGAVLFGEVGCLACHGPPDDRKADTATSVPFGDLPRKYSLASLAAFLREPHKVRPSARMPVLARDDREALDLATYLIGNVEYRPRNPNLKYAVYHGNWNNVPKFDELKAVKTGVAAGFELSVAGRGNEFGVRFQGLIKIPKDGEYTFHLGSDDGSILTVDGKKIADADGIHPHTVSSGTAQLKAGMHPLQVDYHQGGGEATLTLEMEGPGLPRQDANRFLSLTAKEPEPAPTDDPKAAFQYDSALVPKGRELFASLGCASCHQQKINGEPIRSTLQAPPMNELKPGRGCLTETNVVATVAGATGAVLVEKPAGNWPQFDLNLNQRAALGAALSVPPAPVPPTPQRVASQTMTAFNCYACHARDGVGGPERDRNPLFLTSIHEMGDEARIPPPLDGVGDKLNSDWLQHVLQNGAKDRPYMRTHMPRFNSQRVSELGPVFVALDRSSQSPLPKPNEADHRVKAVGRFLAGDKALGCVKCHTFGEYHAAGVQAIDLQTMTRRVRDDWFMRYMVDPQRYRPGTRMPTGYANGQSSIKDVYEGNPGLQLSAIWTFLQDGNKAGIPDGLIANVIELKPDTKPILYRNFLDGLSPRGIAVGYPEKAHLAWDANKCCLTLIWHNRFIDAGKHWEGRGPGFQTPLGDHVMKLEETVPLAVLDSPSADWPIQNPRDAGYHFRGYNLDGAGRPHFRYTTPSFSVEDFPRPIVENSADGEAGFVRRLSISATAVKPNEAIYFRAATGKIEPQPDGWFLVDGNVRLKLTGGQPVIRETGGRRELVVAVDLVDGKAELVEEIAW
jgi:mono/diheme cytochrome c family protein